jgi:hypothetical protein
MLLTAKHVPCFGSAKVLIIFKKIIRKYREAPMEPIPGMHFCYKQEAPMEQIQQRCK